MSWVITATCEGERLAKCIVACPEEAIQTSPDAKQYFIDPNKCTDCGLCDLACPVAAIFPEHAVPKQWKNSIEENRLFFLDMS